MKDSNNQSSRRLDRTVPPQNANFLETLGMFDCIDHQEAGVDLICIDILAQNETGGFDVVYRFDIEDHIAKEIASGNQAFFVFKVVTRGHRS